MLKVKNLHASVDGKEILRGIDLEVKAGEVHAIMGPIIRITRWKINCCFIKWM